MIKIDELNNLKTKYSDDDVLAELKQYFSEMQDITDEDIEKRTDLGKKIFDLMMFLFLFIDSTDYTNNIQDIGYYIEMVARRYTDIIPTNDVYLSNYVRNFAQRIVNTTFEHINEAFYLSQDRALLIAETEANTVINYDDYQTAKANGMTHKIWLSQKDSKVRNSHRLVDDKKISIDEYFQVGFSEMLFPHDMSAGADEKEIVNCRCHIKYTM